MTFRPFDLPQIYITTSQTEYPRARTSDIDHILASADEAVVFEAHPGVVR